MSSITLDSMTRQAIDHFKNQKWQEALSWFDRIAQADPRNAEIHNYRARALESLDRHEDALTCLNLALDINPQNVADLRNRAVVLTKLGRPDEAAASYDAAVALRPSDPDLLTRRALVFNQIDRRDDALRDITRAVQLKPNDADILNSRVIILDNLGRYIDALADVDQMLTLQPNHIDAINNSGMLLARLGRFKDALTCYNRSLEVKPDQPQAIYNRSLIRLSMGDWIRGFKEFESRWNTAPLNRARLSGLGTLWLGEDVDLGHKTILLYHEQGYGDTLQCVRYASLVAERGATVVLAVPPAVAGLLESAPGVARVVTAVDPLPPHDYQTPLMSLPLAFRTTPDTVPTATRYLQADPDKIDAWKQRLGPLTRARIGIVWGGRRYAPINYPRDMAVAVLRPVLMLDAQFISLQKEIAAPDLAALDRFPQIERHGESLEDFADTAALIENLDLVITVDTAMAHLAGALGKPVWLMNRYASCWRWLQSGTQSAWYPSMRIFRQTIVGDWTSVVTEVRQALEGFITTRTAPATLEWTPPLPTAAPVIGRSPGLPLQEKMRFVSATRLSKQDFFINTPLGRSLPIYRTFPKRQVIELRLFPENRKGLPEIYNIAIEEARSDPAILIFIHDDVYLSDYYWAEHLRDALEHFDLVGLAGNKRRVPRQASWMYLDDQFTRDSYNNLSGVLGHGEPFPNLRQLSVYGEPGQEVKLLDGVMMAIRSTVLLKHDLRFDPRFDFHFYDMDFCRQAEHRHIRMGTWAISVVHASAGTLGVDSWRSAYKEYLQKYPEE